jgi:hypothetical protein
MQRRRAKRTHGELTAAQKRGVTLARKQVAKEAPELVRRSHLMVRAREEKTFSGELRRAMHESKWDLMEIATKIQVKPALLADFLAGEKTLESDVLDRLIEALGYRLNPSRKRKTG